LRAEHAEVRVHSHRAERTGTDIYLILIIDFRLLNLQELLHVEPWAMSFNMLKQALDILSDRAKLPQVVTTGARL